MTRAPIGGNDLRSAHFDWRCLQRGKAGGRRGASPPCVRLDLVAGRLWAWAR